MKKIAFIVFVCSILLSFKSDKNKEKYKIAILIDDVGNDTTTLNKFFASNLKITFAVLPFLHQTEESIKKIKQKKYDYILHLPLESVSNTHLNKRTKGLISVNNSILTISELFEKAVENTKYPKGLNNHIGSKFTADTVKMIELLGLVKKYNMYFIDSNTYYKLDSPIIPNAENGTAYNIAKTLNVNTFYNSVFIDNGKSVGDVTKAIKKAVELVKTKKKILIIGHNKRNTAFALYNLRYIFEENNIELVSPEELAKM